MLLLQVFQEEEREMQVAGQLTRQQIKMLHDMRRKHQAGLRRLFMHFARYEALLPTPQVHHLAAENEQVATWM